MKLARNKKTMLENLCDLVQDFSDDEIEKLSVFLKENRNLTQSNKLFKVLLYELTFHKKTGKTITIADLSINQPDPNKPIAYLYEQILAFIDKQFAETDEIEQIHRDAQKKLFHIRALYARKLNEQAVAELLKLESRITSIKKHELMRFHDFSIISQIADLKVFLHQENTELFEPSETDLLMHNIFHLGEYLIRNNHATDEDIDYFKKQQLKTFNVLSIYFAENKNFDACFSNLNRYQNYIEEIYADNSKLPIIRGFSEIYELLLNLKLGRKADLMHNTKLPEDMPLVWVMLFEQLAFEIKTVLNIQTNAGKIKNSDQLFLHAENKLHTLAFTNNFNTAVQYLISRDEKLFERQVKLIEDELHKKGKEPNADLNGYNLLFIKVLFLKLINYGHHTDSNYKTDLNQLKAILKQKPELEFENQAVELFEIWLAKTRFGHKGFSKEKKDKIETLKTMIKTSMKNGEIIHYLIIHAFENNI